MWRKKHDDNPVATRDYLLERIALESIEERRKARRWGIFFKLLTVTYVLFITVSLLWRGVGDKWPGEEHTALVEMSGSIAADSEASADTVVEGLQRAFESPTAAGVLLRINSPGGSAVQSGYIYDAIVRLKKEYPDKPIHAVVADFCASGGYYVAAAADNIYANRASLVGSIGVIMGGFGFVDTMEKLGVERRLITAGEHKAMLDPFSPIDPKSATRAKAMVDNIHEQFIDAVRRGRGDRLKETEDMFSGMIWTGEQAVDLGLVDGLLSPSQVARDVLGAEEIVDYSNRGSVIDQLGKQFGVTLSSWFGAMIFNDHYPLAPR